jgi:hypothetical protein
MALEAALRRLSGKDIESDKQSDVQRAILVKTRRSGSSIVAESLLFL